MRDRTARTGWARGTAVQDTGDLAPRRSFAGARRTRPSGARFDSILAWDGLRGMRNPPGPRARGGEACRGLATARLGCGRRWNVGVRCPGLGARLQVTGSSATGRGGRRDTHQALNWGGVRRSGVDGHWSGGGAPGKSCAHKGRSRRLREARTRRRLTKVERRQGSVSTAVRRSSEPRVVAKAALGFWG